jgi:hypothetical protein
MSTNNHQTPNPSEEPDKKEENPKQDARTKFLLHQRMLSAMVKKGYAELTLEERAYWNSVY